VRERPRLEFRSLSESHAGERRHCGLPRFASGGASDRNDGGFHVVQNGQLLEQAADLERASDPYVRQAMGRPTGDIDLPNLYAPSRGLKVSGNDVDERRLAGSVRTDESKNLAALNREADVIDGTEPTEVLADSLSHQLAAQYPTFRFFS
jgi:hypothetical protein